MTIAFQAFFIVVLLVFAATQFVVWSRMSKIPLRDREAIVTDPKTAFYNRNPIMYAIFGSIAVIAAVMFGIFLLQDIAAG